MQPQMSAFEHYEHGLVLKEVRMFTQAIDDFRKAARDPVFTGKALLQIALCLKSAERHAEAVMAFREALATRVFSPVEQRHIHYHVAQVLETLGRHEESLEIYRVIRREDPTFRDVAKRSQHPGAGRRGQAPQPSGQWNGLVEEVVSQGRRLKPHLVSLLEQTGQWVSQQAEELKNHSLFYRKQPVLRKAKAQRTAQPLSAKRLGQPVATSRGVESRRHPRTSVRLKSHFSAKGRRVTGEGELRDLSPWGCRVKSPVAVPIGVDLECCIFPQGAANPFIVDGATVRWINAQEFGLSFTSVRPGVQRQIAQLCRTQVA